MTVALAAAGIHAYTKRRKRVLPPAKPITARVPDSGQARQKHERLISALTIAQLEREKIARRKKSFALNSASNRKRKRIMPP